MKTFWMLAAAAMLSASGCRMLQRCCGGGAPAPQPACNTAPPALNTYSVPYDGAPAALPPTQVPSYAPPPGTQY